MTIVKGIWRHTDSLGNLKTGKDSKEWSRRQNKISLTGKSMKLPTKSVATENL